ncbi:unnamed protein product [Lota lota]
MADQQTPTILPIRKRARQHPATFFPLSSWPSSTAGASPEDHSSWWTQHQKVTLGSSKVVRGRLISSPRSSSTELWLAPSGLSGLQGAHHTDASCSF